MNALRIFRSGLMVGAQEFRIFWNWRTWFGGWILRTFTTAATWALLGKALGSQQQLRFILIGMAVIQGTGAVGWTVAASTWDRMDGIYPLLVAAPPSLVPSLMGRTVVWMLNGLATFFVTFAILASVFRMPIPFSASLLLPVVVAIICASYYAFALFMGSLVIRAPQLRNVVHNVASTIITTICGVVVPVNFWPSEIGWAASVLPVTHGLTAARLLLDRGPHGEILRNVSVEAAVGAAWMVLALVLIDRMANLGRYDGSIEFT